MAVNFLLFPPIEEVPNNPPSRFLWIVVFLVLTFLGSFFVFIFWPKGEAKQTSWFWICLLGYPIGIAAFVVLRRYSVYEGRRLDVMAWNDAREKHIENVFDAACCPLNALASAYRFSANESDNGVDRLLSGALMLKAQFRGESTTEITKSRWLAPLKEELKFIPADDHSRQVQLMEWLVNELLDDVSEAIRALPSSLRVAVQVDISSDVICSEASQIWEKCWMRHKLPRPTSVTKIKTKNLMILDQWLDRADTSAGQEARLMVFIQLDNLLDNIPPEKSAEAGVAMLIAPVTLAEHYKLGVIANIHRPMQGRFDAINHVLEYALKWGRVTTIDVARTWKTGFDIEKSSLLTSCMMKEKIHAPSYDLDNSVGNTRKVAPWLALACAIKVSQMKSDVQLVAHSDGDHLQLTIVAPLA